MHYELIHYEIVDCNIYRLMGARLAISRQFAMATSPPAESTSSLKVPPDSDMETSGHQYKLYTLAMSWWTGHLESRP